MRDEAVKQLESFAIGTTVQQKYKSLQIENRHLQELEIKNYKLQSQLSYKLQDLKLTNIKLEDKLRNYESNELLFENQMKKKDIEMIRLSDIKLNLEVECRINYYY